jgi:murein DD-endopeptidase MepM/ murein hydrolase activator NlpD
MLFVALANARKVVARLAAVSVLGVAAFAAPAHANSAAADTFRVDPGTQVNRDITALGEADTQFRSLHASWIAPTENSAGNNIGSVQSQVKGSVPSLYPVEMQYARKSSGFGRRGAPVKGASTNHKGVDLAAPIGTPIYVTGDGVVTRAGWANGYGKVVYVDHGNGIETRYAHMSGFATEAGTPVRKGDLIGYVGSTGRSSGPHLHYEVRIDGVAQNPNGFMQEARENVQFASN